MRISDWSSDVCSSDLVIGLAAVVFRLDQQARFAERGHAIAVERRFEACAAVGRIAERERRDRGRAQATALQLGPRIDPARACQFLLIPPGDRTLVLCGKSLSGRLNFGGPLTITQQITILHLTINS